MGAIKIFRRLSELLDMGTYDLPANNPPLFTALTSILDIANSKLAKSALGSGVENALGLAANASGGMMTTQIAKRTTESEIRTSTTRLADDVLKLPVVVGGFYKIEPFVRYTSTGSGIGFDILTPGYDPAVNANGFQQVGSGQLNNLYSAGSTTRIQGAAEVGVRAGSGYMLTAYCLITASGDVSIAWGTSNSGAGQTAKLLPNSFLFSTRYL